MGAATLLVTVAALRGGRAAATPAPLDSDDVIIEPRHIPLPSFGLTSSSAWFGNGLLARGPRPQRLAALRTAAEAFVTIGQAPRPLEHDPWPPLDGLWWTFDVARGAWLQSSPAGVRWIGSGVDLLAVLRALV